MTKHTAEEGIAEIMKTINLSGPTAFGGTVATPQESTLTIEDLRQMVDEVKLSRMKVVAKAVGFSQAAVDDLKVSDLLWADIPVISRYRPVSYFHPHLVKGPETELEYAANSNIFYSLKDCRISTCTGRLKWVLDRETGITMASSFTHSPIHWSVGLAYLEMSPNNILKMDCP